MASAHDHTDATKAGSSIRRLLSHNYSTVPFFFRARSSTLFILTTVGVGIFSDLFLYGLVVPILPFLLVDKVGLPESAVQSHTSGLLAAYAAAAVILSPVAGAVSDRTSSRQLPFVAGISALIASTIMLFTGSSVAVLAIARTLQGASAAFVWTVGLALCVDTVGSGSLGTTIGTIFSICSVGELFAPVVGGTLYEKAGINAVGAVAIGVLVVDLVMRLLVIEKKVARRYAEVHPSLAESDASGSVDATHVTESQEEVDQAHASESSPLLPNGSSNGSSTKHDNSDPYHIPPLETLPYLIRKAPILYTLTSASLLTALLVALTQPSLIAAFDATIPTHAKDLFNFDSLTASLLFAPLGLCNIVVGPLAGWVTDRHGTKLVGVAGYAFLVPVLALLRVPVEKPFPEQAILYAGILSLCGVGLACTGPPSIVEAGATVEAFHERNPGVFGEQGPYAQLYGMNSLVFNLGLSVGPVLAGVLKEGIGYGNMNAVLAGISGCTAVACYFFLGGRPRRWMQMPEGYSGAR